MSQLWDNFLEKPSISYIQHYTQHDSEEGEESFLKIANCLKEFIQVAEIEIDKWESKYFRIIESLEEAQDDK